MFRKSIMLAIAATVSLGAFALSSSDASAFGRSFGGGGMHAGGGGMRLGGGAMRVSGLHSNPHFVTGLRINKPMVMGIKINPGFNHHVHFWPRWWWWRHTWRRPYWIAPVIATGGVATYATGATYASTPAPVTNTCTCLTKQYTPQGAVVFKDVCTNEMAMNPPVDPSPAAEMAPQMPQQPMQQGYLQPQTR
jgi:hypothetical protein